MPVFALVRKRSYNPWAHSPTTTSMEREDDWAVRALRAAIDDDGRGVKVYAKSVLIRPPSTIYRWLSGSRPIPRCVRTFLVDRSSFRILSPTTKE